MTKKNKTHKLNKTNKTMKHKSPHHSKTHKINTYASHYNKLLKLQCSPASKKKDYSCLSDSAIYKLRDLWNSRHPDVPIYSNDVKEIWQKMKHHMQNVCNKESCWLKQKFVHGKLNKELEDSFAPVSPEEWKKNPNEWLSSVDIMKVIMKVLEDIEKMLA